MSTNFVFILFLAIALAILIYILVKGVRSRTLQKAGRQRYQISILPKTFLGRWSFFLTIAFLLFFVLADLIWGTDNNGATGIPTGLLIFIGLALAIPAFTTSLVSIIKYKERSVLVFPGW